jgi:hypothetical protein
MVKQTVTMPSMYKHRITGSGQRRFIKPTEDAAYAQANGSQCQQDWPSGTWPFLAKRYIEHDCAIHLHVQWPEDAESCDFCLTVECAVSDAKLLKSCSGFRWREVMQACSSDRAGDMEKLVPVEIGQTVQHPQRVVFRLTVPSIKRLFVLDDCSVYRMQQADSPLNSILEVPRRIPKHVSVLRNRKLGLLIDDLMVAPREFARHEIKRGSELVEGFSDESATGGRRRLSVDGLDDQVAGFRFSILDNLICLSLDKPWNHAPQYLEVTHGPIELVPDREFSLTHEVDSNHDRQRTDAANGQGARNPRPKARGLHARSEEGGEGATEVTDCAPPEEEVARTALAGYSGGCTATRTRLGSPEDA